MSRSDDQRIEDILEYAGKIASAVAKGAGEGFEPSKAEPGDLQSSVSAIGLRGVLGCSNCHNMLVSIF